MNAVSQGQLQVNLHTNPNNGSDWDIFLLLHIIYIANMFSDNHKANEGHNKRRICKGGSGDAIEPKWVEATRLGSRCVFPLLSEFFFHYWLFTYILGDS